MQPNSPGPVPYLVRSFADVARDKKGGRRWKADPDWVHCRGIMGPFVNDRWFC